MATAFPSLTHLVLDAAALPGSALGVRVVVPEVAPELGALDDLPHDEGVQHDDGAVGDQLHEDDLGPGQGERRPFPSFFKTLKS